LEASGAVFDVFGRVLRKLLSLAVGGERQQRLPLASATCPIRVPIQSIAHRGVLLAGCDPDGEFAAVGRESSLPP